MPNGLSLRIDGAEALQAKLRALDEEVRIRLGTRAVAAGARLMRDQVRSHAPLGPGKPKIRRKKGSRSGAGRGELVISDYGHLRDNIRARPARKASRTAGATRGYFEYEITTGDAFWGRFLEYGTAKMTARPFMRPAFDSATGPVTARVGAVLKAGIVRAAAKASA